MPKIPYIEKNFRASSLEIISLANDIIAEYRTQGFKLTLRQLYYQFVARDRIPNTQRSYKRLGSIINDGRLAGMIDWGSIEDRTRKLQTVSHWESPAEIVEVCAQEFRLDKWNRQDYRPEVWIEKEALAGVVEGICREMDIPFLCCRGYTSQSEMWSSAMRLKAFAAYHSQTPVILHFGDHDPSGIDMTRDITDRLELFMGGLEVRRLALNMDQIEKFNPPPNPAKMTDSRFAAYVAEFGDESWELDALEPSAMVDLIRSSVMALRDDKRWNTSVKRESEYRRQLQQFAEDQK